jgi:hypothetical protein
MAPAPRAWLERFFENVTPDLISSNTATTDRGQIGQQGMAQSIKSITSRRNRSTYYAGAKVAR